MLPQRRLHSCLSLTYSNLFPFPTLLSSFPQLRGVEARPGGARGAPAGSAGPQARAAARPEGPPRDAGGASWAATQQRVPDLYYQGAWDQLEGHYFPLNTMCPVVLPPLTRVCSSYEKSSTSPSPVSSSIYLLRAPLFSQVVLLEMERRAAVEGLREGVAAERAKASCWAWSWGRAGVHLKIKILVCG